MSVTPGVPEPTFEKPGTQPHVGWPDPSQLPPVPTPTDNYDVGSFIRRGPNGGTVYVKPPLDYGSRFREMPNGGGTVYRPSGEGGGENGDFGKPD